MLSSTTPILPPNGRPVPHGCVCAEVLQAAAPARSRGAPRPLMCIGDPRCPRAVCDAARGSGDDKNDCSDISADYRKRHIHMKYHGAMYRAARKVTNKCDYCVSPAFCSCRSPKLILRDASRLCCCAVNSLHILLVKTSVYRPRVTCIRVGRARSTLLLNDTTCTFVGYRPLPLVFPCAVWYALKANRGVTRIRSSPPS